MLALATSDKPDLVDPGQHGARPGCETALTWFNQGIRDPVLTWYIQIRPVLVLAATLTVLLLCKNAVDWNYIRESKRTNMNVWLKLSLDPGTHDSFQPLIHVRIVVVNSFIIRLISFVPSCSVISWLSHNSTIAY